MALGVDLSVVNRRFNGGGNITLRAISDSCTAMSREPLSNFVPPRVPVADDETSHTSKDTETQSRKSVIAPIIQNPSGRKITNVATLLSKGLLISANDRIPGAPLINSLVAA
jgi:hypothetical protein